MTGARHSWTVPGVLRIADLSDPDHLNPYLSTMDLSYDLSSLMYSYLVIADDRGRLIGDLATEVPTLANGGISRDGRTYTYHLHSGVLWHDGAAFTSRDVLASWRAVVDRHNNTLHREGYDRVVSIDTPSALTVVVHLKGRYPPFVTQFFAPLQEGGKPILPAHVLEREHDFNTGPLSSNPIGTGPFRFVRWDRGNRIILERFDRYFKGRPGLSRVELRIIPDDNTILTEVRLHHVDLVVSPPNALADQYRGLADIVTELLPWNAQSVLILNGRKPGLHDVSVRRAIAASIDYDAIVSKISHDVGIPARNSLPPTALGYEPLPVHRYDPAAANMMLDRAGWKRGADGVRAKGGIRLAFTMDSIAGASSSREIAILLQQFLRAIGIDLEIKNFPYNSIFSYDGPIYGGTYDLAAYSTTLAWDPDVHFYLNCDQWFPRGENTYGYCNPQLDALENAGLLTDDTAQRAAIYRRASQIIWDTFPYLPLYEQRRLVVRSPDLKNFSVSPTATPWWDAYRWEI